jgi:hypothetical protein
MKVGKITHEKTSCLKPLVPIERRSNDLILEL